MKIEIIPLSKIRAGRSVANDRKEFDEEALRSLGGSIEANGLIQPLTLRPIDPPEDGKEYEIVAGERRFRGMSQYTSMTETPAIIRHNLTDEEAANIMLVENTGREDLSAMDEARAYQYRLDTFENETIASLAKKAGVGQPWLKRRLSLNDLIEPAAEMVSNGQIPVSDHPRQQKQLGELIAELEPEQQKASLRFLSKTENVTVSVFRKFMLALREAENEQLALFDLSDIWAKRVAKAELFVENGVNAKVNVPTSKNLPPIVYDASMTTGEVIYQRIVTLHKAGFKKEAEAIGELYKTLVTHHLTKLPRSHAWQENDVFAEED